MLTLNGDEIDECFLYMQYTFCYSSVLTGIRIMWPIYSIMFYS